MTGDWIKNEGKSLLVVRTQGPLAAVPAIRSAVRQVDPDVTVAIRVVAR